MSNRQIQIEPTILSIRFPNNRLYHVGQYDVDIDSVLILIESEDLDRFRLTYFHCSEYENDSIVIDGQTGEILDVDIY